MAHFQTLWPDDYSYQRGEVDGPFVAGLSSQMLSHLEI